MQTLLERYRIDVELFHIEDTFDIENMAYKRKEIIENFTRLSEKEKKEFFRIDSVFKKYIPQIKKTYPQLYELVIKPANSKIEKLTSSKKETSKI
ncbi:MAG: hypothetical protein GXN94_04395 [Aquificae bacterium]|nr:hypothetical protein [Aquificota bacterium]